MPIQKSSQRTRRDHLGEQYAQFGDIMDDEAIDTLIAERLAAEDERMWALHRDPETDLSQIEARDRAQREDYGAANISQATVSRKLSDLDRDMLFCPIECLDGHQVYDAEDIYRDWQRAAPEYLELRRRVLARFIADRIALRRFSKYATPTPEWAQARFPELDPNVGRRWGIEQGYDDPDDPDEVHDKQ